MEENGYMFNLFWKENFKGVPCICTDKGAL